MSRRLYTYIMQDVDALTTLFCTRCSRVMKFVRSEKYLAYHKGSLKKMTFWNYKCGKCNLWQQHYAQNYRAN